MSRQLAELLVKEKVITPAQFADAAEAAKGGKSYVRFLIERKIVAEAQLLNFLSQKFGLPTLNIAKFEVKPEVIKLVPIELAKKCQILPIQANQGTLVVAICDPTYLSSLESVKFVVKLGVEAVLTTFSAFDSAFQKNYTGVAALGAAIQTYQKDKKKELEKDSTSLSASPDLELVTVHHIDTASPEQDAPVIQLVNGILTEAIRRSASDIHIEPYEKRFRVRMRIDGVLSEIAQVPIEMKRSIIARLKVMSRMDIGESRVPQDGRIKLKLGAKEIDFRVSSMPTLFGEKVVLRALSKGNLQLDMLKLGFNPQQLSVFAKGISAANGLVLVTGPTGSGKTTTLYSGLSELNKVSDNISTVEDPVEYNLEGVNQVQVQKEVGLTFASILRALLRQDPDIILVGEIRDYETAEVCIQAALTGHLVLSTLHTNDAPSSITRLMNMGIEPFLVVGSVNTIVAQRLIRTLCLQCKTSHSVPKERLVELGLPETIQLYKGRGCPKCSQTGYKGRIAVYEVLDFSPTLKEMVLKGSSAFELKKQAVLEGMRTLRDSAFDRVIEGVTTLEEALSITMEN